MRRPPAYARAFGTCLCGAGHTACSHPTPTRPALWPSEWCIAVWGWSERGRGTHVGGCLERCPAAHVARHPGVVQASAHTPCPAPSPLLPSVEWYAGLHTHSCQIELHADTPPPSYNLAQAAHSSTLPMFPLDRTHTRAKKHGGNVLLSWHKALCGNLRV